MASIKQEEADIKSSIAAKPKTDPELIQQAVLWHLRIGHANYHAVKKMPQVSSGMGVDFSNLNIKDMPHCDACTKAGMDPFSQDGY